MSISSIRFNESDKPDFFRVLRKRVDNYFTENKVNKHANVNMVIKTIFMLALYFSPLILMLTGVVTSLGWSIVMWSIMGLGMSGIGLSIMHDANHGAYSANPRVNRAMGFVLNFIGGYHVNWKIQHNVLHHSFTNIQGYDEDIEKAGIIRFSPDQPKKKIFKFQLLYAPFLYAILTLYWALFKDYEQLISYHKRGLLKTQGVTFKQGLFRIILYKSIYFFTILALPIMLTDFAWYQVVLGFVLMQAISGLILALVFQSAHVLEETDFFLPDENGSVENSWAIHQMRTTSNFARGNVPLTWFIGGLNHQVEHHLFPTICHVHYPAIAHIVKETAEEFDVPYHEHKTFTGAIMSHFRMLRALGAGTV